MVEASRPKSIGLPELEPASLSSKPQSMKITSRDVNKTLRKSNGQRGHLNQSLTFLPTGNCLLLVTLLL